MDSMEIDDDVYINKSFTMDGLITQVDFQRGKQHSRCLTVCLGLLCAALLAGNIGLIVYYKLFSHPAAADPTQASYNAQGLQSSFDALTAERKQLEARLSNLTIEKDQLQKKFKSLTTERDELKDSFNNQQNKTEQLQASYNTLKEESSQVQTSFNELLRNHEGLQTNYSSLTASKEQLQANYRNLQRENNDFTVSFHQLQGNYSLVKRDKDLLQKSYDTLSMSKNQLQISYNSLWKDKGKLQTRYNALQRGNVQLNTNYSSIVKDRDLLQKKIDSVRRKLRCQSGWTKFDISCYFVSPVTQNWTVSRQQCRAKGADLVVIDSREEQVFVNGLLKSGLNAWIGLTDSANEGTWMWVDGTPVTLTYWQRGQPNSFNGNQDCGELVPGSGGGEWNDDGCFSQQIFICEQ